MNTVIGEILPLAVGVAVSPVPLIAAILMMLGTRARSTSIGFGVGWVAGILVATVIFVIVGGAISTDDGASSTTGWIKLALGIVLLADGLRQWRTRDADAGTPAWMRAIDEMKAPAAAGIGFALAAINPKNLMMCIGAGIAIGAADLGTGQLIGTIAIFVALAASTVLVPVIAYLAAADRLRDPLDHLKAWLEANNKTVMAVLILVIGAVLVGKGIGGI
ncbi:GAP family protein [Gordonia desulfuricans]|uniref:GAP family protein n=1 Tax=Gordonia desulfuricans TaxID=89051 RepID=A0A7K3LUD6_9ACTN|nr:MULTISPECIES: GAP family protein [Gordonia]EMP11045.1 membrane protein [Gordonia sp. NB41Y]NDK91789.1 GAP family protein [Gordonia desulfuricans]WLP92625.1 GAP family protein [Gordonia sp. NB41Y]